MTAVVTGAGGLLGEAFMAAMPAAHPMGRAALDTGDPAGLFARLATFRPDLIVNCAAHTQIDAAEDDPAAVYRANVELPRLLAQFARREAAVLLHISSTGCYGAWADRPYDERDPCRPTTVHHRAKLAGEQAVIASGCAHLTLRTGWLFGGRPGRPRNFVWQRLVEARGTAVLHSDPFQSGNPTSAAELAAMALRLIDAGARGLYNCVGDGPVSRLDYVREIVAAARLPCVVAPTTSRFARRALVSHNEAAINWRLGQCGMTGMPPWRDSLRCHVADLLDAAPEQAATP